jgi:hypothetical protein
MSSTEHEAHTDTLARIRVRAIAAALWFGVMPHRVYEREFHCPYGYRSHLVTNLEIAWRWLTGTETCADVEFELTTNEPMRWVYKDRLHPESRRAR